MRFTVGNTERLFSAFSSRPQDAIGFRHDVQNHLDATLPPAVGGRNAARTPKRVVLAVNGLWEFASLPTHRPLRLEMFSHFLLLVDLIGELTNLGLQCDFLDFRHPGRSAAFFSPPAVVRILPLSTRSIRHEVENKYREAFAMLLPAHACPRIAIIEPEHAEQPIEELTALARAELMDSPHGPADIVVVCGGILSPYFLEHALGGVPARAFLYCYSMCNTTLRPAVYEAALSPAPQRTSIPGLIVRKRPGIDTIRAAGLVPRSGDSPPLARVANDQPYAVIAIGIAVGGLIDEHYVDLLARVRRRLGSLSLCVVGTPGLLRPDLAERLSAANVHVDEVGMTTSIAMTLATLKGRAVVACNPRGTGNGGSLAQVVLAGFPVLIWSANDAEHLLTSDVLIESEAELEDRLVLYMTNPQMRATALTEAMLQLRARVEESRRELRSLVAGPLATPQATL
jgi:hypothetical protein